MPKKRQPSLGGDDLIGSPMGAAKGTAGPATGEFVRHLRPAPEQEYAMVVSALSFRREFARFQEQVRANSGGQPFTSFREGKPAEWEDYKDALRNEARHLLELSKWKATDIGSGRILSKVIRAVEINEPRRGPKNNLVNWQNRYGHSQRSHRALLDAEANTSSRRALEQWFLEFFLTDPPEAEAFARFRRLVGNRYDLIAYMFFLKDWTRFMPIAPTTFDKAFKLLDVDLVTARHCSWENYVRFNRVLLSVQDLLRDVAEIDDARLVDAHSFCWMLARQKLPAPPEVVIPLPVLLDAEGITPDVGPETAAR